MSEQQPFGGQAAGLPFVRPIAREIIEELFRAQSQWKSSALVARVVQVHRRRGGHVVDATFTIKRVLQDLKRDGLVIAPGHGWWRWAGASPEGDPVPEAAATNTTNSVDEAIDGFDPAIRPEKEIGIGLECVYLYFNQNDRRLAELECRDVWECKIGRTGSCDPIHRILSQGVRTALSRLPTVGLVLRTHDSASLENALHSSLRLVGAEVSDSPGNEWFLTSPARVEAWYASFENAVSAIETSTKPG